MGGDKGGGRFQNPRRERSLLGRGVQRWTLAFGEVMLSMSVASARAGGLTLGREAAEDVRLWL